VAIDPRYYRPAEVDDLQADPSKARQILGWEHSVSFRGLVKMMVEADMAELERTLGGGREALEYASRGARD